MLVAVGLVVLMMTLFAQIFSMATGTMQTQKGLAENDQRVRLVMNLLRNDLNSDPTDKNNNNQPRQHRTFRILIPYGADELSPPIDPVTGSPASAADRQGYFCISENNPSDDTDDVLSLTVAVPLGSSERLFGRAALLFPDQNGNYGPNNLGAPYAGYPPPGTAPVPFPPPANYWPNQPEFDDTYGTPNEAGSSPVAEVCYFLRAGTLYRRLLLVRQPNVAGTQNDGNPTDGTLPLNLAVYTGTANQPPLRNFWTDMDYSATRQFATNQGNQWVASANPLQFHGTATAADSLQAVTTVNPFSLTNPAYRFGYDSTYQLLNGNMVPGPSYGLPREFSSGGFFLGRFTQRETSDMAFGYPGFLPAVLGNVSPMSQAAQLGYQSDPLLPYYGTATYGNTPFNGPRAGDDVLMTNVQKFDIKVWDPAASYGPDGRAGFAGIDDDKDGTVDNNTELGWPGSDDGEFVDIGNAGQFGHYSLLSAQRGYSTLARPIVPPATAPPPLYGNSYYLNTVVNPNLGMAFGFVNCYDTWSPKLQLQRNFPQPPGYPPATGHTSDFPPYRPVGVGPDGRPGKAGVDDNFNSYIDFLPNGQLDTGELGTEGSDDFIPMSAIQIKISFYDTTSKQLREVTLVQSLLHN